MAGTVVVACKLPHGLQIRLGQKTEKAGEGRDAHLIVTDEGRAQLINGAHHRDQDGIPAAVGGYGFTPNVDADEMAAWLNTNKGFAPVAANMLFVEKDMNSAKAKARELASETSGFERLDALDPMGDGTIEPTDETKAELKKTSAQV